MPAGLSAKPLAGKLGIKEGFVVVVIHPPHGYIRLLGRLPERVTVRERLDGRVDMIHAFVRTRADLAARFLSWKNALPPDGSLWVSWPKRTGRHPGACTSSSSRFRDSSRSKPTQARTVTRSTSSASRTRVP